MESLEPPPTETQTYPVQPSNEEEGARVEGDGAGSSARVGREEGELLSEGEEDGDANKDEEIYGLFRNNASRKLWEEYMSFLKTAKRGEKQEEEEEVVESSIVQLTRLDARIMTVMDCLIHDVLRGGLRQKKYVEAFHRLLPIAMEQISKEMYDFVQEWETKDVTIGSVLQGSGETGNV